MESPDAQMPLNPVSCTILAEIPLCASIRNPSSLPPSSCLSCVVLGTLAFSGLWGGLLAVYPRLVCRRATTCPVAALGLATRRESPIAPTTALYSCPVSWENALPCGGGCSGVGDALPRGRGCRGLTLRDEALTVHAPCGRRRWSTPLRMCDGYTTVERKLAKQAHAQASLCRGEREFVRAMIEAPAEKEFCDLNCSSFSRPLPVTLHARMPHVFDKADTEEIIRILCSQGDDRRVALAALLALCDRLNVPKTDTATSRTAAKAGGIHAVIAAMQKHRAGSDIREWGTKALRLIVDRNEKRTKLALQLYADAQPGGCDGSMAKSATRHMAAVLAGRDGRSTYDSRPCSG